MTYGGGKDPVRTEGADAQGGAVMAPGLSVVPPIVDPDAGSRILVVDDDPDIARFLEIALASEGFDVRTESRGPDGLAAARAFVPHLILLDVMMPGMDGYEVCRRLRSDPATASLPVIILTAKSQGTDKVMGLTAGADDYIVKPFMPAELIARVASVLRRSRHMRDVSPLTGLPGNSQIRGELGRLVAAKEPFAFAYADLDNFKAYNDCYGFVRGDEAIVATAGLLADALDRHPTDGRFLGHVGGDDFVLVTIPEVVEPLAADIVRTFDEVAPTLYDPDDVERGYVQTRDRQGNLRRFPLLSISLGIATTAVRDFQSHLEVATVAADMKTLAKRREGSAYEIDRRRTP